MKKIVILIKEVIDLLADNLNRIKEINIFR